MSDLVLAKAFLQKGSSESNLNLYDHLTALIHKILVEQPPNAVDHIEEYSRNLKQENFQQRDVFQDEYQPPPDLDFALKYSTLLEIPPSLELKEVPDEDEEQTEPPLPNLLDTFFYFEQMGIALPKHEIFCLGLSIQAFSKKLEDFEKIRYWGKIYGKKKNYHVLEVKFSPEALEETEEEGENEKEEIQPEENEEEGEKDESIVPEIETRPDISSIERIGIFAEVKVPPFPKAAEVKIVEIKNEEPGTGLNSKVYYVCSELIEEWVKLPDVTPAQISAARQIKLAFTGDLDSEVATFPPFPGKEINYLRAQIARISAGTLISPLDYYDFDEDEDYEDENERSQLMKNEEFEPVSLTDLTDPSMAFWVHQSQHILQQGRALWWNPKEGAEDEDEDEESEEEEEEEEEEEPEVGPPLLTSLSEDTTSEFINPWSVTLSTKFDAENAFAVVRSNLWPGAAAYCTAGPKQKFENIYMGWGHKYSAFSYSPTPMPTIQSEYKVGPECMEVPDPTIAEEKEYWMAKERKRKWPGDEDEEEIGEGEGGEDDEGEEDEDDEDEDDDSD
ncbi:radial spoke head protein 6 homolog A [Ischnura elegans]|uniref:radial spoke head protein 6 homolog A n=1 Tax=Ischnura elegans TaxID=197161 RepID=UPI001ED8BF1B|nr:radial spoke head protein 6 homolog A [Ischnura elegans]